MKDNNQPSSKCRTEARIETYARRAGKALVGLTTAALLASPFATDKSALADKKEEITVPLSQVTQHVEECELSADQWAQAEVTVSPECVSEDYLEEIGYEETEDESEQTNSSDQEAMVETEKQEGGFKDFQVDEFRIHNFDGDPEVEGVFADNKDDGAYIFTYPVGEKDGQPFDKGYFIPGEEVREVREGYLSGEDKKEFSVFTDKSVFNFDWDIEDQTYRIEKYDSPRGQEITDGQIVDGRPVVSVNERLSHDTPGIYQLEEGRWEPFKHEGFDAEEFAGMVEEREIFDFGLPMPATPITNIAIGDTNDDGEYEVVMTNKWESIQGEHVLLTFTTDGRYSINPSAQIETDPMDIQIGNLDPGINSNTDLIFITDGVTAYEPGQWRGASFLERSGKDVTDFNIFPYNEVLPEEAREFEDDLEAWTNFWRKVGGRNGGVYYPWIMSTADYGSKGLLVSKDRDFRDPNPDSRVPYFFDFEYKDFWDFKDDTEVEELS